MGILLIVLFVWFLIIISWDFVGGIKGVVVIICWFLIMEEIWDEFKWLGFGVGVRDLGLYNNGVFIVGVVILISWLGEGVELFEGGVGVVYRIEDLLFVWLGMCKNNVFFEYVLLIWDCGFLEVGRIGIGESVCGLDRELVVDFVVVWNCIGDGVREVWLEFCKEFELC